MASSSSPGTITVINAGHGFSWVGCYVDGQNPRALAYPGISTTSSSMTVEYCASFCVGYNYMGVEYADECYCADTVSSNSFLATTETGYTCESNTYACAGNASEFCGGYGTLDLYAQPDQTTTAAYPDDTGGSYVYVTDSHIVHAQNSTNGNVYDYIGCWTDPGDAARALNGAVDDGPNDVGTCADFCQDYGYFGLENGGTCYCGNTIDNGASLAYCQNECYTCCSIDLSQRCGGYYRLSLYELNGPSNFTDPHPDAVCTYNGPATAAATVISSSITSTYTYYGPITTGSTETLVVTTDSTGATTSYTSTSYACVDDGNCATNPHTPGGPSSLAMNMPTGTETTTVLSTSTTTLSLTTTVSGVLEGTETTTAWSTSTTTLSLPTTVSSAQASATASAMCPGVRNGSVSADAAGCVYSLYCGYELDAEATTIQGFASGDFTVCEALCDGVAGCVGFTWVAGASGGGGTCYLKPGGGELVATGEGYVGGVGVSGSCASGSGGGAVGSSTVDGSTSVTSSSGSSAVDSSTADGSTTVTSSVVATDSGFSSSSSSSSTSSSSTATASTSCAAVNGTQLTTSDCKTYDLACGGSSIQGTLISSTDAAATNADCAGFCDDSDGCLAWTLDGEGVCRVYSSAAVSQSTTESGTTVSGVLNQTASAAEACVSSPTAAASPSATSSTTTTATTPSPTGCDAQNDTQLTSSACSTYTLYCHSTIPSPPIATTTAYSANACASTCDAASTCTTWSWDPSTTTCTLYDTTDAPLPDPSATNPLLIGTLDPAAQDPTCVSSSSSSPDTACDALNATQISTSSCRTYTLFCASTAQDASSSISVSTQSTNYACAAFCDGISGCASWTWDGETGTCGAYASAQLAPSSDPDLVAGVLDASAASATCPAATTTTSCPAVNGTRVVVDDGCEVYDLYCGYAMPDAPIASRAPAGDVQACAGFCAETAGCQAWSWDVAEQTCGAYDAVADISSADDDDASVLVLGVLDTAAGACAETTSVSVSSLPATTPATTTSTRPASLSTPLPPPSSSSSPTNPSSSSSPSPSSSPQPQTLTLTLPQNRTYTYTLHPNTYIPTGALLALTTTPTTPLCATFCADTPSCVAWTLDPGGDCYAYTAAQIDGGSAGMAEGWVTGVAVGEGGSSSAAGGGGEGAPGTSVVGSSEVGAMTTTTVVFGGNATGVAGGGVEAWGMCGCQKAVCTVRTTVVPVWG